MIELSYIEKGYGLHEALSGLGVKEHDGVWIGPEEAQAIIDSYTLDQAKARRALDVNLLAKAKRDQIVGSYSYGETSSWPVKAAEVMAYEASGDPTKAPMLSIEAQARGVPIEEIIARVAANARSFSRLEAELAGVAGKHRDAINALDSFEAVNAYDISAGWPG